MIEVLSFEKAAGRSRLVSRFWMVTRSPFPHVLLAVSSRFGGDRFAAKRLSPIGISLIADDVEEFQNAVSDFYSFRDTHLAWHVLE